MMKKRCYTHLWWKYTSVILAIKFICHKFYGEIKWGVILDINSMVKTNEV